MPERMVVDIVVAAIGALIYALVPGRAADLGGKLFFAGAVAALFAQR